jgi:hypothetical protein
LRFAAAKKTEQLSIADILAAKLGNVARDDEIRAANGLALRLELRFLLGFR